MDCNALWFQYQCAFLQYGEFPDAPMPATADFQAATKGDPNVSSNGPAPAPALLPKRTTLFGSVMNRLVVSSSSSTPASSGADYTGVCRCSWHLSYFLHAAMTFNPHNFGLPSHEQPHGVIVQRNLSLRS